MPMLRPSSAATAVILLLVTIGIASWYVLRPAPSLLVKTRVPSQTQVAATDLGDNPRGAAASTDPVYAKPASERSGTPPERPAIDPLPPAPLQHPDDRSPLADELNRPQITAAQDVAIVYSLFDAYRERFGGIPTGEDNPTIVNALTGNNPRRIAFIERTHPAINARGEMVDRWGNPLFFHIESRDAWEIRSAGPDGEMYTADDVRKSSPSTDRSTGGIP